MTVRLTNKKIHKSDKFNRNTTHTHYMYAICNGLIHAITVSLYLVILFADDAYDNTSADTYAKDDDAAADVVQSCYT